MAQAGKTGTLTGTVVNEAGAPVAGASVVAISATSRERTTTDAHGLFAFVSLTPDIYTIVAVASGYTPTVLAQVSVTADQSQAFVLIAHPALKIVSIRDYHPFPLVRTISSDVYGYRANSQFPVPPSNATIWLLRLTPGVTFGPGTASTQ
jgi:hypothetical protein